MEQTPVNKGYYTTKIYFEDEGKTRVGVITDYTPPKKKGKKHVLYFYAMLFSLGGSIIGAFWISDLLLFAFIIAVLFAILLFAGEFDEYERITFARSRFYLDAHHCESLSIKLSEHLIANGSYRLQNWLESDFLKNFEKTYSVGKTLKCHPSDIYFIYNGGNNERL